MSSSIDQLHGVLKQLFADGIGEVEFEWTDGVWVKAGLKK